ncbi:MAG TPA: penicillin amidase, partial [Gammaproteobacteria bacterium]|nr:penicillin amidase [Gammaproteobacteria bacterium]
GFVRVVDDHNTATMETTQWVIFKDLTHKKLYYRTYDDLTLRAVDLAKLDFSKNAKPLKMSISNSTPMVEVTDQFKAVE